MLYKYTARNASGKVITDVMDAKDTRELMERLRQKKLIVTKVTEGAKGSARSKTGLLSFGKGKIKMDDIIMFSRQLATMIESGLPLVHSLGILQRQARTQNFRDVLAKIKDDVESGGQPLSTAIGKHTKVFSTLFINMVRAGEISGTLDGTLSQLATYLETSGSIVKKIKAAMIYPVLIGGMSIVIGLGLLLFVVPMFEGIYADFGGDLPLPTKILMILSNIIKKYFVILFVVITALVITVWRLSKTEKGKFFIDKNVLKLPIAGTLIRKIAVAKVTRTLGTLIKSGVSILDALLIVGRTSGNKVIEQAIKTAQDRVREGESIAKPLRDTGVFPPMVTEMISVGEETGELEKMLTKVADFYEDEVDTAVTGLTATIEPVMIVGLGVGIGGMVIALYLPIFNMSKLMGG